MHELIKHRTIPPEDRSALAQCLFEHYKLLRDPTRRFEVQFPRLAFGMVYDQLKKIAPQIPSNSSLPFLEAIATQHLVCQRTNAVVDGACHVILDGDRTTVIDSALAELYVSGPLRKTVVTRTPNDDVKSIVQRLSLYSGGRFESVSYFKTAPALGLRAATSEHNTADEEADPLAIFAPKDLPSLVAPVLTRNATGTVVVYLGQTKAVPPAKYVSYLSRLKEALSSSTR